MSNSVRHPFSFRRVATLAGDTLTELTRLKVFYVLLLFALVLIGSSAVIARLSFQQEFQVLKDISLGAMSIFTSLLAIVATARLLPQDVDDRTIYTILARPVHRSEYLLGKLSGVLMLLAISTLAMSLLFTAVLYAREQSALAEAAREVATQPAEQQTDTLAAIRAASFNPDLLPVIATIYIKASLLAALTLFISTFATTNIFTVVVSVSVYFIGHLEGTAREFWLQENGGGWLSRTFLAVVALVFPDLQLFNLADDAVASAAIPLAVFLKTLAFGGFYTLLYLLLAVAAFAGKEL